MEFYDVVGQVLELLQREKRVSYRALKRQFSLDDGYLEDVKEELIYAKKLAADEDDRVLVWVGDTESAIEPPSSSALPEIASPPVPASYTPAYLAEKILTGKTQLTGERKVVTILFADIKDSTELIRDLDPEAAQRLLDPALHIMMEAVHRFEGTVNQVLGDGIMSLFGAPIAHEDHAVRACYAALAMQAAMRAYTDDVRRAHGVSMQIRVGLNSGEVVVRAIGNDLHMDYSAVGQTTHLAARMEQLASPGSIMLTAETLRLVEGLVRVESLGPVAVKGVHERVEVFQLTGASSIRRRLQAAVARGLTKFVGRDVEIDALNQALQQAGASHGQIVSAVGLAGVGKSRLFYEFVHSHRTQAHRTQGWRVLESASVSYGKATPYFPVIDLLKRYAHVEDGDDARAIRAKVTGQIVTLDESLQDTIPALLSLLDALPDDSSFLDLDPPQRRQRTLDGLKRIMLRESQAQPLVLVFEDLHWIDSETQALLDSLVESLPTAQLLLLVNYRPEYTHHWVDKTYYTQLHLDPLPSASADAFLDALLGDNAGLEALKTHLIERTEGNPFFLEESVRALVETQVLTGEPGAYYLAQDPPTIQAPATVQAVLAARIDRLPEEAKRLLQTAAVFGVETPLPLLQAIAEMPEDALYRGLAHLQATEFLYETSLFPERAYTFKHALTHEVAYGGLLQERRRMLHARIVETIEALGDDRLVEQVERLAYHAMRGEVWDKALLYCRQAGEKAMTRTAYREAVGYFEQALSALPHLSEQKDTLEQAIDLRLALRSAIVMLGNFDGSLTLLREAETIAVALDDHRRLGRVSRFLARHFTFIGAYGQAIVAAQRALTLASASRDAVLHALTSQTLGNVYQAQGNYHQAIACFEQTMTFFDETRQRERFGQLVLPAVLTPAWLAYCYAELGAFAEGRALAAVGCQIAEAVAHPISLLFAYWGIGLLALRQGDIDRALPLLERTMVICQDQDADLPRLFIMLAGSLGETYILSGHVADAASLLTQALEKTTATQTLVGFRTFCNLPLGMAHMLDGRLEEAHTLAEQSLVLAREREERGNEAYALRLLGDIAIHRHPPDFQQAKLHYQRALTLANELGMRPLQAHCHRGFGNLYSYTNQIEQARAELSTAIDMYRDMEMSFWVPETEAALAAVEDR